MFKVVLSLSSNHVTAFWIEQQLCPWCFVIRFTTTYSRRFPMCQWGAGSSRWCRRLLSCMRFLALIPKFSRQPGLGVISFQFIQTYGQYFVLLAVTPLFTSAEWRRHRVISGANKVKVQGKCAHVVCQIVSNLVCACQNHILPNLVRFYWDTV